MATITRVNVTAAITLLVAANGDRQAVTFINRGTVNVIIGDAAVTTTTGLTLRPQEAVTFRGDGSAFSAVAVSGTQSVEIATIP